MSACGLNKMVESWDMEYNKVIRQYYGHLSGVYSLSLNPDLSLVLTGMHAAHAHQGADTMHVDGFKCCLTEDVRCCATACTGCGN